MISQMALTVFETVEVLQVDLSYHTKIRRHIL